VDWLLDLLAALEKGDCDKELQKPLEMERRYLCCRKGSTRGDES
jgi:hypothetical protein